MKFGAQVTCYRNTWDDIRNVAEALDAGPWESIWFADHFLPPPGRKEEEHLTAYEAFTLAAAVAGFTSTLRIGHLVLGNTYRNPGLTAKMAAPLTTYRMAASSSASARPGSAASTPPTAGPFRA